MMLQQPEGSKPEKVVSLRRDITSRALERTAEFPLIGGNSIAIFRDAGENYPRWLEVIRSAKQSIHLESFIIYDDQIGRVFADALCAKAKEGVKVRVIYDWLGNVKKSSSHYWNILRQAGVDVRCFNPFRFSSPLGWLLRDHRKVLVVDQNVGFVTGLCIGDAWVGSAERGRAPWRDTGVEVKGPAVAAIDQAFAHVWEMCGGGPLAPEEVAKEDGQPFSGTVSLRVVAHTPQTSSLYRLDMLIAAIARKRLWLTDAYFVSTLPYTQALQAAARDGVDVRLMVPRSSDIPVVGVLSRAGYRPLLQAGVRVFEWNGSMLHSKTAVADGVWSRVGSTNLNIASWIGNYELDLVVEDKAFAEQMERMYMDDLQHTTEVVLDAKRPRLFTLKGGGLLGGRRRRKPGRVSAGVLGFGAIVGSAAIEQRELGPAEAVVLFTLGLILFLLTIAAILHPALLLYPFIALGFWGSIVLMIEAYKLYPKKKKKIEDVHLPVPAIKQEKES
jgi:cardiolipin synthase A/B